MGYHIFLIGPDNFTVSLEHGVYGGHSPERSATRADIVASFSAIKPGDFVFFYVTGAGLHGLWKATTPAFYDPTPVWSHATEVFPIRVCFEPVIRRFPRAIGMADLLDLRDRGRIWTFDLGSLRRKNHNPITEAEGKELIRLLLRNNPVYEAVLPIPNPYPPHDRPLPLDLTLDAQGRLKLEGYLNAWFTRQFAEGRLKQLIGEYRDVLNYVPTSFNTVMDLFLTHVTSVDSVDILHKFSCIELKTGTAGSLELHQLVKYENWLVRKLASGDAEMVQSVLVAYDFDSSVLEYVGRRREIEEKSVRLIRYRVDEARGLISLDEVSV